MYTKIIFIFQPIILFLALHISSSAVNSMRSHSALKVIIDTDLDSDVDDAGALAMLYNLHRWGEIELVGVIVTSDDPYAPVCAAALNTYYGLSDIPAGFLKNQENLKNHSRYTKQIAEEFSSGLESWKDAEDALDLYRKILAKHADESLVVVTIGHLSSLQGLLQSGPDKISALNGKELAHKKIKNWICMGGQYPAGKEANFYRPDPGSTIYCLNNWDKEVVLCGWELGNQIITGGDWLKQKLASGHPVYRGYELYNGFSGRQSWDQTAILQLTKKADRFFSFVRGNCIVAPDGSNIWEDDPSGNHRYVVLNSAVDADSVKIFTDHLMAGDMSVMKQ